MTRLGAAAELRRGLGHNGLKKALSFSGLVLGLLLGGCVSLPGDQTVATPEGQAEISQIDGQPPVLVFESGLMSRKEVWDQVVPVLAATHTVFAYNRPGIGNSTASPRPRTGADIVEDLRALLRSRHLPPPYLLVGHSAGGLYMQLFARRYPAEVAGLVLVEPTHSTQFEGDGSMQHRSALSRLIVSLAFTGPVKAEFDALSETGRQVLSAPPVRSDLPIIVIVAPDNSGSATAALDNAKRADFARLYPQATVREVDGGHNVPQTRPQAVIDAIRDVLGRVAAARP